MPGWSCVDAVGGGEERLVRGESVPMLETGPGFATSVGTAMASAVAAKATMDKMQRMLKKLMPMIISMRFDCCWCCMLG